MNSRILSLCLALACIAGLSACASTEIEISYTRPPGLEVPGHVKKVGIAPFKEEKLVTEKSIGDRIQRKIESYLVKGGFYKVITRSQLETLLKEQKLSFANFSEGSNTELKVQVVDAMILGTVNRAQSAEKRGDYTALIPVRKGALARITGALGGERYQVKELRRARYVTADVAMSFQMIDYKGGGTILAAHEFSRSYDSRYAETFRDKKYGTAPENLGGGHVQKLEDIIEQGVNEFLALIAPSHVEKSVKLLDPTHHTRQGVMFAKRSLVDEALEQFELAIQNDPPEQKHAALYDKGVMLEVQGRYQQAFDAFKEAYTLYADEVYLDAMERMKKEISIAAGE